MHTSCITVLHNYYYMHSIYNMPLPFFVGSTGMQNTAALRRPRMEEALAVSHPGLVDCECSRIQLICRLYELQRG